MGEEQTIGKLKQLPVRDIAGILLKESSEIEPGQLLSLVTEKIMNSPEEWDVKPSDIFPIGRNQNSENPAVRLFELMKEQVFASEKIRGEELIASVVAIDSEEVRKQYWGSGESIIWYTYMLSSLDAAATARSHGFAEASRVRATSRVRKDTIT